MKSHKDAKELDVLLELGNPAEHDDTWTRADLHDCPSCGNLHTMTLKSISVTDDDGEHQQKELEVVNHVLLNTEEAHQIRALGQALQPEPVEVG